MMNRTLTLTLVSCLFVAACASGPSSTESPPREKWAIAIHAGAGGVARNAPAEEIEAAREGLRAALDLGREMLSSGASGLDTVEAVIATMEDYPSFNAGRGAVFTAAGQHELDSSIMNGATLECGAVAGVTTVKNPIRLARLVMERTRHVLLAGAGAESFADTLDNIVRVPNGYFSTPEKLESLERWRARQAVLEADESRASLEEAQLWKSTVGCVVLDAGGNLVAGTSTGGMTGKRFGRVGDSPVIGAGTYASNDTCAVSCTGTGEEYIRHSVAHEISSRMRHGGLSVEQAAHEVIFDVLQPDDGGVIVVDRNGTITMPFNTGAMNRGAANASGRFDIELW